MLQTADSTLVGSSGSFIASVLILSRRWDLSWTCHGFTGRTKLSIFPSRFSEVKSSLGYDCLLGNHHLLQKQNLHRLFVFFTKVKSESESRSVVSDSFRSHGLYSPWNSPGQNTGAGSLSLLQGIFRTQRSNPGLPHCRHILYQLSHRGSPRILEWVAYPFSRGPSQPRNWTRASCIAGRFFTSWAIREALQGELCIIDGYKEFHSLAHLLHPTKLSHSIYRYVINTNSFQSVFYLQGFHFQNESVFTQRPYMLVV